MSESAIPPAIDASRPAQTSRREHYNNNKKDTSDNDAVAVGSSVSFIRPPDGPQVRHTHIRAGTFTPLGQPPEHYHHSVLAILMKLQGTIK